MEKQWNARLFLLKFANNEQITNKFFRKVQFFKSKYSDFGAELGGGRLSRSPPRSPSPSSHTYRKIIFLWHGCCGGIHKETWSLHDKCFIDHPHSSLLWKKWQSMIIILIAREIVEQHPSISAQGLGFWWMTTSDGMGVGPIPTKMGRKLPVHTMYILHIFDPRIPFSKICINRLFFS